MTSVTQKFKDESTSEMPRDGFYPLRGSNSKCRVPKEMSGHGKGHGVKSIPKADREIGKRVSQIVLKMPGKLVQPGFGK